MKRFKGYIFDQDGTIYRGSRPIPGAPETLRLLREGGARLVFLSNNPTKSREEYVRKLTGMGVECRLEEVVNSSHVVIQRLLDEAPEARLYIIGEAGFREEVRRAGLRMAERPEETDIVLLSFDRTFHYGKWLFAHLALQRGARLWATNPDRTCPTEDGDTPDCGSLIPAIEACSGARLERMTGKPSADTVRAAAACIGLPMEECVVVGDRLETDILMARNASCPSALVLTGITTRETLARSDIKPDYVLESIVQITE